MPHCIEQKRCPVRGPRRRLQNMSTHRVSGKFYTNFSTVTLRFTTALKSLKLSSALSGNRALKGLPGKVRSPTLCCACGLLALWFIATVVNWRLWLRFVSDVVKIPTEFLGNRFEISAVVVCGAIHWVRRLYHRAALCRRSNQIKKIPPIMPVTIPMGMSSGAMIVRAAISAQSRNTAPKSAEAGNIRA